VPSANRYERVIAHVGAEAAAVREAIPDAVFPSTARPTSDDALAALAASLSTVTEGLDRAPGSGRFAEEMTNVARFQFGDAGRVLVEGATFKGRFPNVRFFKEGVQVAMYTERGLLSLTLDGGRLLSTADAYWVEIEDFLPKGNVFAVGVTAAAREVRVGDDVVVRCGRDVRAVGTARMAWREMTDAKRGEAVHIRHATAPKP